MRRLAAAVIGCVLLATPAAGADPALTLYGAGSLRGAMLRIIEAFRQSGGTEVSARFGLSGAMRERIEAGDKVDIFTSPAIPRGSPGRGWAARRSCSPATGSAPLPRRRSG